MQGGSKRSPGHDKSVFKPVAPSRRCTSPEMYHLKSCFSDKIAKNGRKKMKMYCTVDLGHANRFPLKHWHSCQKQRFFGSCNTQALQTPPRGAGISKAGRLGHGSINKPYGNPRTNFKVNRPIRCRPEWKNPKIWSFAPPKLTPSYGRNQEDWKIGSWVTRRAQPSPTRLQKRSSPQ